MSRGISNTNYDLTAERNSVIPPRSFTSLVPNCQVPEIDYYNPLPAPSADFLPLLQFYNDDCEFPSSYQENRKLSVSRLWCTVTMASNQKRRRRDEDDDLDIDSDPASPRSYPPFSHKRMPNLDQVRPIAMPK